MQLSYQDLPDYQFPYWLTFETTPSADDLSFIMDVNQWVGQQCGDLGVSWGYERTQDTSSAPPGLNPVRVRLHHTKIFYSWRFKNKADAMAFKLAWGGA